MKKTEAVIFSIMTLISILAAGCTATTQVKEESPVSLSNLPAMTIITGINVADNTIEIRANTPFVYTVYKPSDPFRAVVEIPNAEIGAFRDTIKSAGSGITEVIPSQVGSPRAMARLEIILQSPSNLEPAYNNNVLTLKVKEEAAIPLTEEKVEVKELIKDESPASGSKTEIAVKADEAMPAPKTAEEPKKETAMKPDDTKPLPKATEITDIRFEQADGTVKLIIKGNGSINPSVFTLKDRIVVDVPDATMKAAAPPAVVPPVKGIRTGKHKDKTRLVLDLRNKVSFDVTSIKDTVVVAIQSPELVALKKEAPQAEVKAKAEDEIKVEAKPEVKAEVKPDIKAEVKPEVKVEAKLEAKEPETIIEGRYTGRKISLDFQDADITPIFRLLSDVSGYNIVVSPEVKGKLTMKLINVPWDQTLDLIIKTFSLGKSVEGNIIRIAPLTVFAKESEERQKAKEAEVKAEPLDTRVFSINYADVSIVEAAITKSRILTPRGSLSVDKRTSSMVVKDVPSVFPQVESLLTTLDRPTPQVMIEARIVEINTTDVRDLGIQWGVNVSATNTLTAIAGYPSLGAGAFTGNRYLVDFPSAAGAGAGSGFNFGIINPARSIGLDLQISAIETAGKGKIISNPKILTIDNGKAKISQGDSIPIRKLTAEGTISTEFKDYTLELSVTPHITPDNSIAIAIETKKEEPDWSRVSAEGTPASKKREANTNVIIRDGETVVIGGVFKTSRQETDTGVPGLMDLPLVGWLFKNRKTDEATSEMLIFITPRIVQKP